MGGGIAMSFANAGFPVALLEADAQALERGEGVIRSNYQASVARGKLTQEEMDARLALIRPTLSYGDLADADLIIEAVFEDIGVKHKVFDQLDAVARSGAILATNTSYLEVCKIAEFTRRPQDVVGMRPVDIDAFTTAPEKTHLRGGLTPGSEKKSKKKLPSGRLLL